MRHAVMENDIIAKLLQRISDNRLALTNWYRKVENVTPAGVRTITRMQWAEGLKAVLKLNIPFLDFQDYLGLPKLGVDGKKKGDIDFMVRMRNRSKDAQGNMRGVIKLKSRLNDALSC